MCRHQVAAAVFFAGVLGVVAAAMAFGPRTYRSQSKLFLRLGRENSTLDPTATLGQSPVVAFPPSRESEINSVLEVLKSRVLLERVADRIGPAAILGRAPWQPGAAAAGGPAATAPPAASRVVDDRYLAVAHLSQKVVVEAVRKSNVIQISYEGASPDVARGVVEGLVEDYLVEHVRINRTPGAHEFLVEQTGQRLAELTRAEEALRAAKEETGLIAPEAQRQLLVERIARLETELAGGSATTAAAEAEVKALRDRVAALPASAVTGTTRGLPNQAADAMRAQLYTLQVRELELRTRHPEGHPEIALVRRQTAAAEALLAKEEGGREQVTVGPHPVRQEAELALARQETVLAAQRARSAALAGQLAQERARLNTLTRDQLRIAKLQRDAELLDGDYRRLVAALERSRIDRSLEAEKISNVSVVQPATFDVKPVRPSRLVIAGLGLAFATLGAVGLALLLDTLRPAAARPAARPQGHFAPHPHTTELWRIDQDGRNGQRTRTP